MFIMFTISNEYDDHEVVSMFILQENKVNNRSQTMRL